MQDTPIPTAPKFCLRPFRNGGNCGAISRFTQLCFSTILLDCTFLFYVASLHFRGKYCWVHILKYLTSVQFWGISLPLEHLHFLLLHTSTPLSFGGKYCTFYYIHLVTGYFAHCVQQQSQNSVFSKIIYLIDNLILKKEYSGGHKHHSK